MGSGICPSEMRKKIAHIWAGASEGPKPTNLPNLVEVVNIIINQRITP